MIDIVIPSKFFVFIFMIAYAIALRHGREKKNWNDNVNYCFIFFFVLIMIPILKNFYSLCFMYCIGVFFYAFIYHIIAFFKNPKEVFIVTLFSIIKKIDRYIDRIYELERDNEDD